MTRDSSPAAANPDLAPQLAALPDAFLQRLQAILSPRDYQSVCRTFVHKPCTAFRVNTLLADRADVLKELRQLGVGALTQLPWFADGFVVDTRYRERLTNSAAFTEGRIYIQNPASMLAPLLLEPRPEEEILDLAAAPGGKTLMLAAMMQDRGRIAAVEPVKGRFFRLKNNLETFGANCVDTYLKDGRQVGWKVPERFDRVLLDAPCSSESRFDANDPVSYKHWNERKVKEVQRKQKKLICSALAALKPGGVLVYSTCSYSPEENELVVQHALKKFAGAVDVEPMDFALDNFRPGLQSWKGKSLLPQLDHCVRVLPDDTMHGFFLGKIRKQASFASI